MPLELDVREYSPLPLFERKPSGSPARTGKTSRVRTKRTRNQKGPRAPCLSPVRSLGGSSASARRQPMRLHTQPYHPYRDDHGRVRTLSRPVALLHSRAFREPLSGTLRRPISRSRAMAFAATLLNKHSSALDAYKALVTQVKSITHRPRPFTISYFE